MSNVQPMTQKPFADQLELVKKDRKTREFKTLAPVYLKKLSEKMIYQDVADLVGVSDGAITKYLAENKASQSVEMAARLVWEEKFPTATKSRAKQTVAIIRGELTHIKTIEDMVRALGGDFQHIGEF